jgi:hypothetical protein
MTPAPCETCGFDPTRYARTDALRTVLHAADLLDHALDSMAPTLWITPGPATTTIADVVRSTIAGFRIVYDAGSSIPLPSEALSAAYHHSARQAHDVVARVPGDPAEAVELAHRALHLAAVAADLRSQLGDRSGPMTGAVAQISSSDGGVPKLSVERATIDLGGVVGDRQRSRVHHGRQWQGLCLYSREILDALRNEGHPIDAGCVGENLTLVGLDWSRLHGGVIIEIGDLRCRLTAPAAPCTNIAQWFREGEYTRIDHHRHPGWSRWYATVLTGGTVTTGDLAVVVP